MHLQPVPSQLVVVAERLATRVAHVALLAGVRRPVAAQAVDLREALAAELAAVAVESVV